MLQSASNYFLSNHNMSIDVIYLKSIETSSLGELDLLLVKSENRLRHVITSATKHSRVQSLCKCITLQIYSKSKKKSKLQLSMQKKHNNTVN